MTLQSLRDTSVEPFEGAPYEWVSAVAQFAVDPVAPANAGIVDLDLAPRTAEGHVEFDADLRLLRPTDPNTRGNGKLLFVVANRGFLGGVPFSLDAPMQFGPSEKLHPGDGHLLEQGWTIAWCGWQWDVTRGPGVVGLQAPLADVGPGWMRIEFKPDADQPDHSLSDSMMIFTFTDYPTADLDDTEAVLAVRVAPNDEPVPIARERWRFTSPTTVALDGGFEAFHWYTLTYRTSLCPVTGTGMLAVRDAVSHLRREAGFTHAYGYGVSQSGRLLRQFLYEARNLDEQGEVVFDGVFAHIAGGRRGEFNHRYAQPSLTHVIGFSNLPPYDTSALLQPQRAAGGVPKLLLTNTSWEYWRGDGALVHIDPQTGADLPPDPDARAYLLAGTDHIGGFSIKEMMPTANPIHTHDTSPILRALFAALVAWVEDGTEPPPQAVPSRADGTAASREEVLAAFHGSAAHLPDVAKLNVTRDVDLGPQASEGIGGWPLKLGTEKPAVVSAVDADGNERAGIALPVVAVPVASYTGWNPRRPVPGLPDVLYEFVGSRLPLLSGRDPAPREDYEAAVRAAAADLVTRRLLLDIDAERTVREALAVYDSAAP
ncbi:MAG TPA: alpha/beta hydrolase domain-containing protein [Frankiaceae bacterium]|nr:alpha/beta hydrolase domain-containing protein [Frankiaceae bacterium]